MHESIVFCSTCTMSLYRKFTFAISSPDEFLVLLRTTVERSVHFVSAQSGSNSGNGWNRMMRDRQHRSAAGAPPRTPPGPGEAYNAAQTPVAGGKGQPAQGSAPSPRTPLQLSAFRASDCGPSGLATPLLSYPPTFKYPPTPLIADTSSRPQYTL